MSFFSKFLQHIPFFKNQTVPNEPVTSTDTTSRTVAVHGGPTTSLSRANTNLGDSLSTQKQTKSREISTINTQFIGDELYKTLRNFNAKATLSLQDIQKLCNHVDHLQDLKELKLEAQKNIVLYILKDYNTLNSVCSKTGINTQALTNNISKIFKALDLNNTNIQLSDNDLKVLNLASFDNNEKTNFNDLLNLLRKLHNFTGKTKISNKIHLEILKQSIINNLNAIKREANDTQIVLPKNQTTSCIEQKQNIIDDPKATPKKSNDSQILLLKTQITNYIEQELSIPTDFLKELLNHLSDPSGKELNTFVNTIIKNYKNEQTGSTANNLHANQKENPTPPIPRQNSEKNHEDVPHNQLNKKIIQKKFTPHSQHAIPTQQPLQTPQTQPTKISINHPPQASVYTTKKNRGSNTFSKPKTGNRFSKSKLLSSFDQRNKSKNAAFATNSKKIKK